MNADNLQPKQHEEEIRQLKEVNKTLETQLREERALDKKAIKAQLALNEQMTHLRARNGFLESQATKLYGQIGEQQEIALAIRESVPALEPLPPVSFSGGGRAEATMAAAAQFSDWHISERIEANQTEGLGVFNWAIAQQRADYITQKIIGGVEAHRLAFKVPTLHILAEGDFVSGDIHEELRRTNEFDQPVASILAGELLARQVATLAPHFDEIHVHEIGSDNHGRLQAKPQFKNKSMNSWNFVVYSMANALLKDHKNVVTHLYPGIKELVDINGIKFLAEHGDTIKAWMGIPYYGIERHRGKEATRRMQAMLDSKRQEEWQRFQEEYGFDYFACGHWHVAGIISGNILVNGSLSGTSEFDHGCGRYAKPTQTSFYIHPKYKLFDWTPWTPKI